MRGHLQVFSMPTHIEDVVVAPVQQPLHKNQGTCLLVILRCVMRADFIVHTGLADGSSLLCRFSIRGMPQQCMWYACCHNKNRTHQSVGGSEVRGIAGVGGVAPISPLHLWLGGRRVPQQRDVELRRGCERLAADGVRHLECTSGMFTLQVIYPYEMHQGHRCRFAHLTENNRHQTRRCDIEHMLQCASRRRHDHTP
jgi:hypothetical protein